MNKIEQIKQLVNELNEHSYKYYVLDEPSISDKQYDSKYDELLELEKETGYILSSSPTQKVQGQVLDGLTKVKHSEPMLSADKTKDINQLIKFMKNKDCVLSYKLDGLTIVLKYDNGEFIQAITRGGGDYGEDITHNARVFTNIPLKIDYKGYLEIRGEGLVTYSEFKRINDELTIKGEEPYSHVRNLASGSVRQLDSNVTKDRRLIFKAFGIVKTDKEILTKIKQFDFLSNLGFDVVEHNLVNNNNLKDMVEAYQSLIKELNFATDGLILEFNDIPYGKSLGSNGHHTNNIMAFKWQDDTVETVFDHVEWSTNRTGIISPTAVFKTCLIDNTEVSKASIHNIDIMESLELGKGDIITVYKANMIIPQIDDNLTRSNTEQIPDKCPSCNQLTEIKKLKTARFLFCNNENCPSKNIQRFVHFVSKNSMDIQGMSEANVTKFIEEGFIKNFADIFNLLKYKKEIVTMDGYGVKSYNKLIESIEKAKNTDMWRVLVAVGIPQVGVGTAKLISKHFNNDMIRFIDAIESNYDFSRIDDVGEITNRAIHEWWDYDKNSIEFMGLLKELTIKQEEKEKSEGKDLSGLTFVITGDVHIYKNRDELKDKIESLNGKTSGSVSSKTNYLINNDVNSTSGKNKKAKDLNIPIINEEQFEELIRG